MATVTRIAPHNLRLFRLKRSPRRVVQTPLGSAPGAGADRSNGSTRATYPPYSPSFRSEGSPGSVAAGFRDRASRRHSRSYGEDLRPSETLQTPGMAAPQ